jgi:hypothetical protein
MKRQCPYSVEDENCTHPQRENRQPVTCEGDLLKCDILQHLATNSEHDDIDPKADWPRAISAPPQSVRERCFKKSKFLAKLKTIVFIVTKITIL